MYKRFSDVAVVGLSTIGLTTCDVQYPIFPAIMNFTLMLTQPAIKLQAHYKLSALAGGIIPIFGEGLASISFNLTAGVFGQVAMKNNLTFNSFDYILGDLGHLDVQMDGLLDNPELAETVANIIETQIVDKILGPIVEIEAVLHKVIVALAIDLFAVILTI